MSYDRIVLSSGHGLYVRGASGVLDEVNEARKVVDRLAGALMARGVDVDVFHDNTSRSQNENLNAHRELSQCVHARPGRIGAFQRL
jgi:N-acetylmuramoyl-L-alanine amidase